MKTALILAAVAALGIASHAQVIGIVGSDSMIELVHSWAEDHDPGADISGGGSSVGIAALIAGKADIAMSSRELKPAESMKIAEKFGAPPVVTIVAYDALAIYVHKDNPVKQFTLEDLREIFLEGGKIDDWKELGARELGVIVPVGRKESSGSHQFFREAVGGNLAKIKPQVRALNDSAEVVDTCAKTTASIGYAPLSLAQPGVKALPYTKGKDGDPVPPTPATVRDGSYPISRKFYLISTAKANAGTKKFLKFVTGAPAQKVAAECGLIPIQ